MPHCATSDYATLADVWPLLTSPPTTLPEWRKKEKKRELPSLGIMGDELRALFNSAVMIRGVSRSLNWAPMVQLVSRTAMRLVGVVFPSANAMHCREDNYRACPNKSTMTYSEPYFGKDSLLFSSITFLAKFHYFVFFLEKWQRTFNLSTPFIMQKMTECITLFRLIWTKRNSVGGKINRMRVIAIQSDLI